MKYILSVDQGTTGTKALLVDQEGQLRAKGYAAHQQFHPAPGWVEHDVEEIWECILRAVRMAMAQAGAKPADIAAVALSNQGETVVAFSKRTLRSLARAIVWSDRRTVDLAAAWEAAGWSKRVAERTGLRIDPYFSATKIQWLLQNQRAVREALAAGDLWISTLDAWMMARMTGGAVYRTDPSTASRTLLYDIHDGEYALDHLSFLGIPRDILPDVVPTAGIFGVTAPASFLGIEAPIVASLVDQPAALYGHLCLFAGDAKCTYGTGCFVYTNTGDQPVVSRAGMLSTLVWDLGKPTFALEGGVYSAGAAVDWVCTIGVADSASELAKLAESVPDTAGTYFVPALTGLAAPYWDSDTRGAFVGLSAAAGKAHLARAVFEGIAHRVADVIEAMTADLGRPIQVLRVDGGLTKSAVLMQVQADLLGVPIEVPVEEEATGMGAAYLAGVQLGWFQESELAIFRKVSRRIEPGQSDTWRQAERDRWKEVVRTVRSLPK
jgi:glycerol kinase